MTKANSKGVKRGVKLLIIEKQKISISSYFFNLNIYLNLGGFFLNNTDLVFVFASSPYRLDWSWAVGVPHQLLLLLSVIDELLTGLRHRLSLVLENCEMVLELLKSLFKFVSGITSNRQKFSVSNF